MRYLFNLFLVLYCLSGFAQMDNIDHGGKHYLMLGKPLEQFFANHPEKKPRQDLMPYSYSNYDASFEIKDGQLHLKDIFISNDTIRNAMDRSRSIFKDLFGAVDYLDCDFYTGLLILGQDEDALAPATEHPYDFPLYTVLEIQKGRLIKSKELDRKAYRTLSESQLAVYKTTDDYKKQMAYRKAERAKLREALLDNASYTPPKPKDKDRQEKELARQEAQMYDKLVRYFITYYNWIIPAGF